MNKEFKAEKDRARHTMRKDREVNTQRAPRRKTLRTPAVLVLTLILAMAGFMASFTTAFADEATSQGTKDNPAQAAITKILQMPDGTTTPGHTYTFAFSGGAKDGGGTAPQISSVQVAFTSADTGSVSGDTRIVKGQSMVTWPAFSSTGIYSYTLQETQQVSPTAAANEAITYSKASYTFKVYVAEEDGVRYVQTVVVTQDKDDTGTAVSPEKKDPTPGDDEEGTFSALAFTNTYVKTNTTDGGEEGTGPADKTKTGALYIDQILTGSMADSSLPFTYTITLTKPSLVGGTPSYSAYLVNAAGRVASPSTVYDNTTDKTYSFTSGTPKTINIRQDERLVFVDVAVGTKYVASTPGSGDYKAKVKVQYNGGGAIESQETAKGASLSTEAVTTVTKMVGEAASGAAFTHNYDVPTPTGIIIDNLPYLLLIALALAGLGVYVVSRTRRRNATREMR
jgi:hypothetical protein